ncbi:MAG: hypothetical protein K2X98_00780 [Alphaproteobacteria bacterium]|nr:hypothetical protein [Alphaproteobacteria bacterium]
MSDNRDNDPSTPRNDPHAPLIFRDEALSHLSSPGDMNKLVTLTRPYTWILLIIFIMLTGIGILWSIYVRIPITLQGQGILIPKGGIFESITAPEGVNTIQELTIHPGGLVTKDQIVALLDNPELKKNIADRSYYIDVLKEKMIAIQKEG